MDLHPSEVTITPPSSAPVEGSSTLGGADATAAGGPADLSDLSDLSDAESPSAMSLDDDDDYGLQGKSSQITNGSPVRKVGYSPVGSSITRPLSAKAAGVKKVYGRNQKNRSTPNSPTRISTTFTSRPPPTISSPLTPLTTMTASPSPSKRGRKSGARNAMLPPPPSLAVLPSTPSKRGRGAAGSKVSASSTRANGKGQSSKAEKEVEVPVFDLTAESPSPSPRKRGRPPKSKQGGEDEDDGTTLSPSFKRPKTTARAPLSKKKFGSSSSFHELTSVGGLFSLAAPMSTLSRTSSGTEEVWSLESLKDFAWVKINENNSVYEDDLDDYFWWPAKVVKRTIPVELKLFCPPNPTLRSAVVIQHPSKANILPLLGDMGQKRFTAHTFQSDTILISSSQLKAPPSIVSRWQEADEAMAEEEAQTNDGFPTSISALYTPSQSQRLTPSKSPKKGQRARSVSASPPPPPPNVTFERDDWSPPPPDDNLSIPGELVYSKYKKAHTDYWPAKVLDYIGPLKQSQKPKYKMHFLDKKEFNVTREMFYSQDERGFATCPVGPYKTDRPTTFNDSEQDDLTLNEFKERLSTNPFPAPSDPIPNHDEIYGLPMEEQFALLIPILNLITQNSYPPAEERHSMFMKGGKSRTALSQSAGANGLLIKLEVDKLLACIEQWLQNRTDDEAKAAGSAPDIVEIDAVDDSRSTATAVDDVRGQEDSETRQEADRADADMVAPTLNPSSGAGGDSEVFENSAVDNPTGISGAALDDNTAVCETDNEQKVGEDKKVDADAPAEQPCRLQFRDLTKQDMLDYASNVLLPEAIYQLLLWRKGERRSLEPLSDEEEKRLHKTGVELANEVDWVKTLERLREMKVKRLNELNAKTMTPAPKPQLISSGTQTGTRSRPRNA